MTGPRLDLAWAAVTEQLDQAERDQPPAVAYAAATAAVLAAMARGLARARGLPASLPQSLGLAPPNTIGPALEAVEVTAAEAGEPYHPGEVYQHFLSRTAARDASGWRLVAGPARRDSGSHYTPLPLAAEVVAGALELLPGWRLAVCDPAAGGGVFLVAACQALARRHPAGDTPRARTEIVLGCLAGADRDPLAADLTRLALWLTVADPSLPLAAVAGRVAHGDALFGPGPAPHTDGLDWDAAFPAVMAAGGFDAVVGNPPFLGGSFISGALGRDYRTALVEQVAGGQRGNADLCAYFLLRATELLRPGGCAGLICTNTIAEGATQRVGLAQLPGRGGTVYRAVRQRVWPSDARLQISLVWFRRGAAADGCRLDGRPVAAIDPWLREAGSLAAPRRLPANCGLAFNGTKIYGQGFIVTADEAAALVAEEPHAAEVILPYLSGDDLLGRLDRAASRRVIAFFDWPWERAQQYPRALDLVRQRVWPERRQLAGRNPIGQRRADHWWQFGAVSAPLYQAAAGLDQMLAKVIHTATWEFVPVPTGWVYSHALAMVASADMALFAVLQSGLHEVWARRWGSSLGSAPRYTLSKTFETFPRPPESRELVAAGRAYRAARDDAQVALGLGLTRLAARRADPAEERPEVVAVRQAQEQLDHTVAAAYGWLDLDLSRAWQAGPCGPEHGLLEPVAEVVLARLLELNRAGG